jgi:hypothetical protein
MTNSKPENTGPDSVQDREELAQQLAFMRAYRDWAIAAMKQMPEARPGSGVNVAVIQQKLHEIADAAAAAVEWMAAALDAMPERQNAARGERPYDLRYVNMSISEALDLYFEESQTVHTEEEIIRELESGGAIIGRKRHVGEIKKSIEVNTRNGKYKNLGGRIGPADWQDKRFK